MLRRNPDVLAVGFVVLVLVTAAAVSEASHFVLRNLNVNRQEHFHRKVELIGQRMEMIGQKVEQKVEQKAALIEQRANQLAQRVEQQAQRHAERAERLAKVWE